MTDNTTECQDMSPLILRSGPSSAEIYPDMGGRLGQLDLGTGPLLRGPAVDLGWVHWGCYPLLPWSNRLPGGHLAFGTIDEHLPVNWPDGTAIHGLAASCPWAVVERSEHSAKLEVRVSGGPYHVLGTQCFELGPRELQLRLAVTNEGDRPVPVGLGIHPWFVGGRIRVPADKRWPGEPMPSGYPEPVEGPYDLRGGTVPVAMDACFTSLTSTVADVPGLRLHWDGPVTNLVVYSAEPGWICVEPVTMANNGFELAQQGAPSHGVQVLAPEESMEVLYRFERQP